MFTVHNVPPGLGVQRQGSGSQLGEDLSRIIGNAVTGALGQVRAELQRELDATIGRRDALEAQIANMARGEARNTAELKLSEANVEVGKLRTAIEKLESQTTPEVAPPFTTETGPPPPPDMPPVRVVIPIMGILFIGFPLAIAFARIIWRRAAHPPAPTALAADSTRRFDQLEQSVDAIAIEVERISENQRYLTKLLSEPRQNAVESGKPQ